MNLLGAVVFGGAGIVGSLSAIFAVALLLAQGMHERAALACFVFLLPSIALLVFGYIFAEREVKGNWRR